MGVFETGNARKYSLGSGVVPQTPVPLHTMGQQKCFWIPGMGVFATDNAKKIVFGFRGGAPNTHTAAHPGPEKVFLDTWDRGVCNGQCQKKYCFGSLVVPQTPIPLHTLGQKRCFWMPGMGVFVTGNGRKHYLGSGVVPQTPMPLHPMGQQRCFWIPKMGVFAMDNAKKTVIGFRGGAPNTHTSAPHGLAKAFLDTWDGGV